MRQLLRLNVVEGTGKNADVKGYEVGGKTGTAEKAGPRRLPPKSPDQLVRWHVPDERSQVPRRWCRSTSRKAPPETGGYATGGMVAAPSVKAIIENIIALYGILPGDWSRQTPLEIASTPIAVPPAARGRRSWRRRRAAARPERKALPAARAADRRRPHRECAALRLSELMGTSAPAARSGRGRPDAQLAQGPARFPVRRPRRLHGRRRGLRQPTP